MTVKKRIWIGGIVFTFVLIKYGIISKGDMRDVVKDVRYIAETTKDLIHEFAGSMKDIFGEPSPHKPKPKEQKDTTATKEKEE